MWRSASIALAVLALARPSVGLAAETDPDVLARVERKAAEAREAYQAQDFEQAVALYLEAWRLAPAGAILYNIAHIYDRKLKELDLAIEFYRRYIASPDADPAAAARATRRIRELKAEKAAREEAELERMRARREPAPQPEPTPARADTVRAPVETTDPGADQRLMGWIGVGVGAAMLATAGGLGVAAQSRADDFGASVSLDQKKSFRDEGETFALTADVLYAVGGVAAVTGVVLLLTAPEEEPASLGFGPTSDGAGAAVWWGGEL